MKTIAIIIISLLTVPVFAQVDINKKMDLLKLNVDNSTHNFNEYKANFEISVKNFNESTRVVNELRKLKIKALKDGKRAEANARVYGQVIEKYDQFIKSEEAEIAKENQAVLRLQELIAKIQQNSVKRQAFIANYQDEISKSKAEIESWKEKKRQVASVITEIDTREAASLDERKKWQEKKGTYRKETEKWAKERRKTQNTYNTFAKLRKSRK